MLPRLVDWWANGKGSNAYTLFETKSGKAKVYVRRHIADPRVMMIANIESISGFGIARALYRTFTQDIPAIAELVLNPELDALLERWGWDFAYRDYSNTPTRVNKAFQAEFPTYATAYNPTQAIVQARGLPS